MPSTVSSYFCSSLKPKVHFFYVSVDLSSQLILYGTGKTLEDMNQVFGDAVDSQQILKDNNKATAEIRMDEHADDKTGTPV